MVAVSSSAFAFSFSKRATGNTCVTVKSVGDAVLVQNSDSRLPLASAQSLSAAQVLESSRIIHPVTNPSSIMSKLFLEHACVCSADTGKGPDMWGRKRVLLFGAGKLIYPF